MTQPTIRFDDGAAYEEMMGVWSRLVGEIFLDWLAPPTGLRWLDVGCGNGAFTQLLVDRCAPSAVHGIDPSAGQLAFARGRPAARLATFEQGDAMALPFPDASFDAAVMALVLVFVPDPPKGVAEMARVARPGGLVASYMWDMTEGGFPIDFIIEEMRAMGLPPPRPPHMEASRVDALRQMWTAAGLKDVQTRQITVARGFDGFDQFWRINAKSATLASVLPTLAENDVAQLKERVRARLSEAADGSFTCSARANAVKGRVP